MFLSTQKQLRTVTLLALGTVIALFTGCITTPLHAQDYRWDSRSDYSRNHRRNSRDEYYRANNSHQADDWDSSLRVFSPDSYRRDQRSRFEDRYDRRDRMEDRYRSEDRYRNLYESRYRSDQRSRSYDNDDCRKLDELLRFHEEDLRGNRLYDHRNRDEFRDDDESLMPTIYRRPAYPSLRPTNYSRPTAPSWNQWLPSLFPNRNQNRLPVGTPGRIAPQSPQYQSPRPWNSSPARTPVSNEPENEWDIINRRVGSRYSDPRVIRFVQSIGMQQGASLYQECSQLIDSRHLKPTSYSLRIRQAVMNLTAAVKNPSFVQAWRINTAPQTIQQYQQTLQQMANARPVQSQSEAINFMYQVVNVSQSRLNIPAGVVIAEFVFGAAESLDKYSSFLPATDQSAEVDELEQQTATLDESIVGIGVEIKMTEQGLRIVKILSGGPAEQAGLKSGDMILTINGQQTRGRNINQAVDLIAGQEGTPVMLGISRDGRPTSIVTLMRKRFVVHTVNDVKMVDSANGIGYLKLDRFAAKSSQELDQALWKLHQQGMKVLIFDVRGNPGGLLTTAIEISNKFIPCGTIVSTRGRTSGDNTSESATYKQTWKIPVVVLIDGDSASASEIFAAAIQDNQRGLIVGTKSYGKGTVQTHFPLRSVSGNLKLTTAKFFSPQGREMAGQGVTPNVNVNTSQYSNASINLINNAFLMQAVQVARSRQLQDLALAAARCNARSLTP